MGCHSAKAVQLNNGHVDNGSPSEQVARTDPPSPTDPRLPLTTREVFKLQQSWKGIKRNMAGTGVEMFVR